MSNIHINSSSGVTLVSSNPATAQPGDMIINTTTDELLIYYAGTWQLVASLTGATSSKLLFENSDFVLLEDGSGDLLLQ